MFALDLIYFSPTLFTGICRGVLENYREVLYIFCITDSKKSACNAERGSIPGSGRSPGEGNGSTLQYSCLGNPIDRGAWWATVRGVTQSRTRLSDSHFCIYRLLSLSNTIVVKIIKIINYNNKKTLLGKHRYFTMYLTYNVLNVFSCCMN